MVSFRFPFPIIPMKIFYVVAFLFSNLTASMTHASPVGCCPLLALGGLSAALCQGCRSLRNHIRLVEGLDDEERMLRIQLFELRRGLLLPGQLPFEGRQPGESRRQFLMRVIAREQEMTRMLEMRTRMLEMIYYRNQGYSQLPTGVTGGENGAASSGPSSTPVEWSVSGAQPFGGKAHNLLD